jgi:hypothetical protein
MEIASWDLRANEQLYWVQLQICMVGMKRLTGASVRDAGLRMALA